MSAQVLPFHTTAAARSAFTWVEAGFSPTLPTATQDARGDDGRGGEPEQDG